jgi:hypothetical protein
MVADRLGQVARREDDVVDARFLQSGERSRKGTPNSGTMGFGVP